MTSPDFAFQTEPEPVVDYLHAHQPEPPRQTVRLVMVLGVIVLAVLLMRIEGWIGWATPWVALAGLLIWVGRQRGRWIDVQQRVQALRELTMLRRHDAACAQAWGVLPKLRHDARLHGQTAMMFAANLMGLNHYDAAIATHDYLLEHIPAEHPVAVLIRLQRVMAYLQTDQLRSADEELRALGRMPLGGLPAAIHASGLLYQQIKTHHHADVIEAYDLDKTSANEQTPSGTAVANQRTPRDDGEREASGLDGDDRTPAAANRATSTARPTETERGDDPVATFCPLGIEAAYPYAMLAAALHHRDDSDRARAWWAAATRLRPADQLIEDLPELAVLQAYPPAPSLHAVWHADGRGGARFSEASNRPAHHTEPPRAHPTPQPDESPHPAGDTDRPTTDPDQTTTTAEHGPRSSASGESTPESREDRP